MIRLNKKIMAWVADHAASYFFRNDNSEVFALLKKEKLLESSGRDWRFSKKLIDMVVKRPLSERTKLFWKRFFSSRIEDLLPEFAAQREKINTKIKLREEAARTVKQTTPRQRLTVLKQSKIHRATGIFPECKEGDATYSATYTLDWDGYSRSCKYPKKEWDIILTFDPTRKSPSQYEQDGIPNITCLSRKWVGNVLVEKNECLIRGRGYSADIKVLYVASVGGYNYHAETVKKAVKGALRKLKLAQQGAKEIKLTLNSLITRSMYQRLTGACQPGISGFCEKHGLLGVKGIRVRDLLPLIKGEFGEKKFLEHVYMEEQE